MSKIHHISLGLMLMFSASALAQNQTVKGKVVDENGEPIIGASVTLADDKTKGVVTDFDGNYTISVPANAKITITYIGYMPQTVKAGGTVQLQEDNQSLDEVVVVGYGSQKKAHLTGSVATVPVDDIQDLANGGLASTLSGLVGGMSVSGGDGRPGENARITIRDVNALGEIGSTAQQPLFVIDGYIYPNDVRVGNITQNLGAEAFNNLDPSEVESISVLKDASAAVYGARAANGVILVTTKKGKTGSPTISYSGQFGFTDEVSRPKMLNAYQYGKLYNAIAAADPTNTTLNRTTALFQQDELEAMKALDYDLLDKYWETGTTMRHSVNVSGGADNVNYFAGVSYFTQDGNLGKLDYDRWNYRAGVDVKVSKWLKANLTVSGDYGKKNKPLLKVGGTNAEKDYNLMLTRPRYMPETVGDYHILSFGPSNGERVQNQRYSYDLLQNNGDYSRNMTSNTSMNASLEYDFGWSKILKGLNLRFSYSKSINNDKTNEYGSQFTVYQMTRRYGSGQHLYTPTAGDDASFDYMAESNFNGLKYANGYYLSRNMIRTDNYQLNFNVQYSRDFGQHHVSALFSVERSEAESEFVTGQANEPLPYTNEQSNSAQGAQTTEFNRAESGTLSYIGRLNYAYMNRYLFEFLLRSDASTKFAPENYWGTFPALSAGWVVSEEPWFQKSRLATWMDFLKLRASWGLTGRDNLAAWQWLQVYTLDKNKNPIFGEGPTIDPSEVVRNSINKNTSAVNRDVHWDKSYKTNIGLDFQVLNKRLSVNFDYYYEKNREMLMNIAQDVPATVGTQSASVNLGEMNNWGWELGITWRDKIGKDFKYKVGINTGYSDNKVLMMDFEDEYIYRQIVRNGRTDIGTWGLQCLGMFRSFQDIEEYFAQYNITSYMGMTKDQVRPGMLIYKDVRGAQQADGTYAGPDGIVDQANDQVQLGKRNNIYGFTTNLSAEWKGLSLTAQLSASWGGYTTVPSQAIGVASGSNIEFYNMPSFWNPDNVFVYQDVIDGSGNVVVPQNRDAYYPNLNWGINSVASSFWRVSNTRVTLNRLTLAYTIPSKLFRGIGIKSCRVNVTGQNLINFYNPYPDNFINPMAGSYGAYPNLRKWTVGVNLSF